MAFELVSFTADLWALIVFSKVWHIFGQQMSTSFIDNHTQNKSLSRLPILGHVACLGHGVPALCCSASDDDNLRRQKTNG